MTTEKLLALRDKADKRWNKAIRRVGYEDDMENGPWTPHNWLCYFWADAWRDLVHKLENQIDRQPEATLGRMVRTHTDTFYEAERLPEDKDASHSK